MWKLPTRTGQEEQLLRELGGRHHLPALLSDGVPAHVQAGAFAMPYYEDRHVTSLDEARVLTADLAEALHYLHSCGYVHCDVKRSNVRFDGKQAVLIDLDLARRWREGDAPLECNAGTHSWLAPEIRGKAPQMTNKVDLYGLGLVLLDELFVLFYPTTTWRGTTFQSAVSLTWRRTQCLALDSTAASSHLRAFSWSTPDGSQCAFWPRCLTRILRADRAPCKC